MTGEDQDLPWMAVFHLTFLDSLQVVGRPLASETPWPVGPRNWGQFSSPSARGEKPGIKISNSSSRIVCADLTMQGRLPAKPTRVQIGRMSTCRSAGRGDRLAGHESPTPLAPDRSGGGGPPEWGGSALGGRLTPRWGEGFSPRGPGPAGPGGGRR